MTKSLNTTQPILLFDGYCNLCANSVQFVLKHEKNHSLLFSSLQADKGKELLLQHSLKPEYIDSLVFIQNHKVYLKSTAALKLCLHLKGLYPLLYAFIIVPAFIRNWFYEYIAKNRYKWYGKKDSCMMPDKELINRFL